MEKAHELSKEKRTVDIYSEEDITFDDMLLNLRTLKGLKTAGFVKPSPIQAKAIPYGRCGFDLIVQAKSGTGKTCVFTVIAMEMILPLLKKIQVVVLAPTREISFQISNVITSIFGGIGDVNIESFIGGLPLDDDKSKIEGCQLAVATPGRMKHLISLGLMDLDSVRLLVLDEADRLMEENFRDEISYIFAKLPIRKQIIAVSATFPEDLENFLAEFMNKPIRINPSQDPILVGVRQFAFSVPYNSSSCAQMKNKVTALLEILTRTPFKQCLVFSNYQSWAENVCKEISKEGWPATFIHGSQKQRDRLIAYETLKQNRCRVFFSTDLSSRGIDVENVNLVVNLDLPYDCATYLHRVGRAGRYGTYGKAVTIVQEGEEVDIFRTLLYNVGGAHFHVHQFPREDSSLDIWEANEEQLEKVSGLFGDYEIERKKLLGAESKYRDDHMDSKKDKAADVINKCRVKFPEAAEVPNFESLRDSRAEFKTNTAEAQPPSDAAERTLNPAPEAVVDSILYLEEDGWNSFYKEFNAFKMENETGSEEVAAGCQDAGEDLRASDEVNGPTGEENNPDCSTGNVAGCATLEGEYSGECDSTGINREAHPEHNPDMHKWYSMWYTQCRIIENYVQYYRFFRDNP